MYTARRVRGVKRAVIVATFGGLAGCSLIFDTDDLRGSNDAAVPDARAADATPPGDADLGAIAIDSVEPAAIWEGQGSAGRPIPVVVRGTDIDQSALISFKVAGDADAGVATIDLPAGPTTVDPFHTLAATTLIVPVTAELVAGDTLTVVVRVSQGTSSATTEMVLHGLDELTPAAGTYEAGDFAALYSRIELGEDVRFEGAAPIRLRATSEIVVAAGVDVTGRNGGTGSGGSPGAGGCAGGGAGAPGGCSMGGGGGGSSEGVDFGPGGGGGGGFGAAGSKGAGGSNGGSAGDETGGPWLVPLVTESGAAGNRGNGGGGGADGTLTTGGGGGGGGGVVELTCDGRIEITTGGSIATNGGNGAPGSGGGGGGGSGGALLLRAQAELTWDGASPPVSAAAGIGSGCNGCNKGGNGGVGRIRLDYPGTAPASGTTPSAVRGPMWAANTPAVVNDAELMITAHGAGATSYGLLEHDATETKMLTTGASGEATALVDLVDGINHLCLVVPDANFSLPEAVNCIDIAYVPDSF